MEPVCSLKRPHQALDSEECIICQQTKPDVKRSSEQGFSSLIRAANERDRLNDTDNKPVIDRIFHISEGLEGRHFWWHKSCYSSFTSRFKIERLERKRTKSSVRECEPGPSSTTVLRSSTAAVNWSACIFCQDASSKGTLCSVTTFQMSNNILHLSKYDQNAHVRLAGVNDLIAAEGKYHPTCFKKFQRSATKTKESSVKTDVAMEWLVAELKESSKKAHVIALSETYTRYCELVKKANVEVPLSFASSRFHFKEKLMEYTQDVYDIVTIPNTDSLLVPKGLGHVPIAQLLSEEVEEPSVIPHYKPHDNAFLEMVHVALMLRGDILAHPKYTGFVVNEDEMIACVPERLFMFLKLMYGGQSLLEGSNEEAEDEEDGLDKQEDDIQRRVLSVAQDLVYNVSQHWTRKHVGLASTLHQATRSADLLHLFHNQGHTLFNITV